MVYTWLGCWEWAWEIERQRVERVIERRVTESMRGRNSKQTVQQKERCPGTCTLRQRPWKMMSSRLWVASRARAIRDHSQTESGRPFLFTFPFETLKSCCVLGCFSGAGRDRTISFHRLPPINRPRLTKVLHNLRTKRVYEASTSSAWGKALWMCQVFFPFSKQRQPRPISKRRGLEPDTDEETDAGGNWQSEQVHVLRWWSWSTSPCRVRSVPSHWIYPRQAVAQDVMTDKCIPVFQLQGQLEMKQVSICWTKLRNWPSDCWKRGKLSWSRGRSKKS